MITQNLLSIPARLSRQSCRATAGWTRRRHAFSTSAGTIRASGDLVQWKVEPLIGVRHVGTITLNSPSTYNALTVEMGQEFSTLCQRLSHDISSGALAVDAVIVTGQGDKAFSAGGNLDWLRSLRHNSVHANADLMLRFYQSFLCIRHLPVPTVAAMAGPAMGAGAGLALACDLRLTSTNKRKAPLLGLNFTRLGIHTGMGAAHLFRHAVPAAGLRNELLLTGRTLLTDECLNYGLLNRLCDTDDVVAATKTWLAEEVVGPTHPLAVRTLLQTLRAPVEEGLHASLQRDAMAQALCYARDDWGEGVEAVAQKRAAVFGGYHDK